jgi:hypothetical protein
MAAADQAGTHTLPGGNSRRAISLRSDLVRTSQDTDDVFLGSESAKPMATSVRTVAEALHSTVTILPGQQHDAMYTAPHLLARDLTAYFLA